MKTTGVSQYLCTYILSIHVNSWRGSVSVLSPQPQKCSQCCAFVQQASRNNSTTHLLLHNCTIAQLHTFLTHNCSIMIYIHTLTDLFIIRKPAWTPVICPNSRVCINVMYCRCWLDPRFCNRFWNGEVMSKAYLAAEMKWDIHWLTSVHCKAQSGVTINASSTQWTAKATFCVQNLYVQCTNPVHYSWLTNVFWFRSILISLWVEEQYAFIQWCELK